MKAQLRDGVAKAEYRKREADKIVEQGKSDRPAPSNISLLQGAPA